MGLEGTLFRNARQLTERRGNAGNAPDAGNAGNAGNAPDAGNAGNAGNAPDAGNAGNAPSDTI